MTTLNPTMGENSGGNRLPPRELLAKALAVSRRASTPARFLPLEYDEVDRRLMDTFPASDAVGRY